MTEQQRAWADSLVSSCVRGFGWAGTAVAWEPGQRGTGVWLVVPVTEYRSEGITPTHADGAFRLFRTFPRRLRNEEGYHDRP